ncbi:MarR family transcriptional regulator [bacterium]|nr:MarR family transcriptional regulator [bacterium]
MQKNKSRTELIKNMIELLHVLGRYVGPGREQFFLKIDLNHAQLKFLYFVGTGKELTIQKLVALTKTTPGAVTQIVDGLIGKGFLKREHDQLDKRRVYIQFSTMGKVKFEKVQKLHLKRLQKIFDVLSDKELKQMISIEKKLVTNLSTK